MTENIPISGRNLMIGVEGLEADKSFLKYIREKQIRGVILFTRNFETKEKLRALTSELKNAGGDDFIIAVDQEGGRVMRFRDGFAKVPPMATIGKKDRDGSMARDVGGFLARELLDVGINMDFAPVVDVATNPNNPVIGDRAFSDDPHKVAHLASEFIRGMQREGVMACAKHFPGHGDTDVDSHFDLPVVSHPMQRLRECELVPFQAAIDAGVASVMTAHCLVKAIDDTLPASISPRAISILRSDMGFKGLIISDDLTMKGIANTYTLEDATRRVIAAGSDIALICHGDTSCLFC